MRSVIKFLNAQNIVPIEIHRELCHIFGHTRLDGQHISCRSSTGRCLIIIHPIARTVAQWFPSFYFSRNSYPVSVSVFRMTERLRWASTVVPIPGGRFTRHRIQTLVPWYDKCLNSGGEYVENSLILALSIPINILIKLWFVSVNCPRETYFVDSLSNFST